MKVVYLNSSGQVGGVERVLLDLLEGVRASEPARPLHIVTPEERALAARARALGVGVTVLPFPPALERLGEAGTIGESGPKVSRARLFARLLASSAATAGYAVRLRGLLRALAPGVIHSNGLKTHVLGAWARPRGAALVWHAHDYVGGRPVTARLMRLSAGRCSVAVANSKSVAEDLRKVCGGRVNVRVVYNAVNLERFSPAGARADLDSLAGLAPAPAGTLRVGLVATLARWKGHRTFLEALALLPREARVRGYVVGGALYRTEGSQQSLEELRQTARELGVADRVGFTGFVGDAAAAMRALDVVVHCSTEPEPFGLVIAEAMACGRALVAARAGGAAELFEEGADALAHTPGDARDLAAQIRRLADDGGLCAALGRAARRAAARRFDRARLAAEWLPIYRELTRPDERALRIEDEVMADA
jgi:glycosyltransferase involved in cell wall biosynthesis